MACWFLGGCCVDEGDDAAVVLESRAAAPQEQNKPKQVEGSVPAELAQQGAKAAAPSPASNHAKSNPVQCTKTDTASTRDAGSARDAGSSDIASVRLLEGQQLPEGPPTPTATADVDSICSRSDFGSSAAGSVFSDPSSEEGPPADPNVSPQDTPTSSRTTLVHKKALLQRSLSKSVGANGAAMLKKGKSFILNVEDYRETTTSALGINIENPGNVRDFYSLGKELGKGTFGSVSKARLRSTEAPRAIKKVHIPKTDEQSASKLTGFLKYEIQIHKMMDHPNIVKLYEIFEDDKYIYMVLEICRDGDLDGLIKAGAVSEPDAAIIMIQVFRAVAYMHMQGVVHRDLKAENMLLSTRDSSKQAKRKGVKQSRYENAVRVTDLGLACTIEEDQQLTLSCGTITHKSPQILLHAYTSQCDLWSCGIILYYMLCNVFPFTGDNEQIKRKILVGKYAWRDEFLKRSPESMSLIRALLEYDEEERVTARTALKNEWFQKQLPKREHKDIDEKVLQRLRGFRKLSKFRRVALSIVVSMLPDDYVMTSREVFTSLDYNGDGFVSVSELREVMEKLKMHHNPDVLAQELKGDEKKVVSKALKQLRKQGSYLDDVKLPPFTYTEFLAATFNRTKYTTEAVCKNAFQLFDKDGSGKLDASELFDGRLLGELTQEEADEVIKDIDTDNDFQIDFREFMNLMTASEK